MWPEWEANFSFLANFSLKIKWVDHFLQFRNWIGGKNPTKQEYKVVGWQAKVVWNNLTQKIKWPCPKRKLDLAKGYVYVCHVTTQSQYSPKQWDHHLKNIRKRGSGQPNFGPNYCYLILFFCLFFKSFFFIYSFYFTFYFHLIFI